MLQIQVLNANNNNTLPINPFAQSSSSSLQQENFLNEVLGLNNNQSNFLSQNYHGNFQGFEEVPQMQNALNQCMNNGGSSNSSSCLNQKVDEVFDATNSSLNSLPNLVSVSPECSAVKGMMENKVNQNECSNPSSTSTTFEMLEDFMYEDVSIDACWKDLLE
jgi:myb proto-oncogene protein